VEFRMNYPIELTDRLSNEKTEIPYFVASHNVKLKEMYELASDITQSEIDTNFLELQTMNLVAIYSGLDSNKLPPFSKVEITTDIVTWTRSNVKDMLMNDVLPYMSFIRIIGANNDWQLMSTDVSDYSIYADGIYNSFEYNLNNKSYDLDADIIYPYSDIYLDFGGSEILKPDEFVPEYPLMKAVGLFIKEYKFKYDISYPLIVKIHDADAFNGEGYDFTYALEVNIRKNVPVKGNITVANLGGTGAIRLDSLTQLVERNITVNAKDAKTGKPLEDVYVYYRCGAQYLIGKTKINNVGSGSGSGSSLERASVTGRFPFCEFGGEILYEKQGYMGSGLSYDNHEGSDPKTFDVELQASVEKDIKVMKRTPTNIEVIRTGGLGTFKLEAEELDDNDTVFLSIKRVKKNSLESDIPMVGFMSVSGSGYVTVNTADEHKTQIMSLYDQGKIDKKTRDELLLELSQLNSSIQSIVSTEKMEFVPGTYVVDAFMIYRGNILIPKETRKICAGIKILGICTNTKELELPEQRFSSWVNGGAKFNFTLTENDVYGNKQKIIFYVLEQPLPENWIMLENYQALEDYQRGKIHLLRPRIE
ncbi:MAG: hypothetical protein ACP5NV_06695, partial [Candidatus Woesearchaeota archaeon]